MKITVTADTRYEIAELTDALKHVQAVREAAAKKEADRQAKLRAKRSR